MQKIIFDTDIGVDDAFALTYAAQSVDIIGITTVFGNVPVAQAVSNARLCSHKIGLNVPVYRGCSRPLVHPPTHPPAPFTVRMALATCLIIRGMARQAMP
ncbi:inosine/uridine-preferring nucleoside hydrolase [Erwinia amylovora MR1]|nr:inosine/uridine-preferring nucleoside hydrolase [Erwinia amylovora MR1]